jgi:mannose-6-phosphate isomerase-like protein (cupin superfamily)
MTEQFDELWMQSSAKLVNKEWGREIWLVNNEEANYCGKILEINPSKGFSMHFHDIKVETFWVLEGNGALFLIDLKTGKLNKELLYPNKIVNIPRLKPHQIINDSDKVLKIVEFSTFHRDEDSYRVWREKPNQ